MVSQTIEHDSERRLCANVEPAHSRRHLSINGYLPQVFKEPCKKRAILCRVITYMIVSKQRVRSNGRTHQNNAPLLNKNKDASSLQASPTNTTRRTQKSLLKNSILHIVF